MKYGNINYASMSEEIKYSESINIGAAVEAFAVERIYDLMGIAEQDRIEIDFKDLLTYSGEYVLLPINLHWVLPEFPLSDHIIPVFLGMYFVRTNFSQVEVDYLKRFSPIGCRDEFTLKTMRKFNIPAYLNGCMTAALEKRDTDIIDGNVYFIDVPLSLKKHIPDRIRQKAIFRYHNNKFLPTEAYVNGKPDLLTWAKRRFAEYEKDASLVVSSRFHAIVPCMALGIPVIAVSSGFQPKFDWLDKYIPLYTQKDFGDIDWNPKPINLENHKKAIVDFAITRIKQTYKQYAAMSDLSWSLENRVHQSDYTGFSYPDEAIEYIKDNWDTDSVMHYSFWGITKTTADIYQFIKAHYPNFQLDHIYDIQDIEFEGIKAVRPDAIRNDGNFIFVTSDSAANYADNFLRNLGYEKGQYFLCRYIMMTESDL
jgi:hypothetical protein